LVRFIIGVNGAALALAGIVAALSDDAAALLWVPYGLLDVWIAMRLGRRNRLAYILAVVSTAFALAFDIARRYPIQVVVASLVMVILVAAWRSYLGRDVERMTQGA
jgi:hypothetical protein